MQTAYLNSIKVFEGFTQKGSWDYAQYSNGYGTKAHFPGEKISAEEAERRFSDEIAKARQIVDKHTQGWDEGTKAALTSLTFNAGPRWINSGLGDAVRAHDVDAVRQRFVEYNKAQGQVLPGLVNRRLAEVNWIGQVAPGEPEAAQTGPAAQSPLAAQQSAIPARMMLPTYRAAPPYQTAAAPVTSLQPLAMQSLLDALFDLQLQSMQAKSTSTA